MEREWTNPNEKQNDNYEMIIIGTGNVDGVVVRDRARERNAPRSNSGVCGTV
jgi:hypothetical protein